MEAPAQYREYRKPSWAPPSWVFGPVWTVLYTIIAVSFGYVFYGWSEGHVPVAVAVPFLLNLVFNFLYTPIQFKLRNMPLASVDILLVLGTLAWALLAIHSYTAWVTYANLPYLCWVAFATVLQLTITRMNA